MALIVDAYKPWHRSVGIGSRVQAQQQCFGQIDDICRGKSVNQLMNMQSALLCTALSLVQYRPVLASVTSHVTGSLKISNSLYLDQVV